MATTTTPQLFVKPLQYVVESTEGTTPTASPSFTVTPPMKSFSIKKDGGFVDVSQVGPEDLVSLTQGQETQESSFVFQISDTATDEAFFQRAIQAANFATPSGTISETFSMVFSFYLDGTENYVFLKGTRAKTVTIKMAVGQPHEVTIEFLHTDITVPNTSHGLTTPTFVTTFNAGTVQDWLSGGTTPVSIIGTSIDCTEFNCTIERNTTAAFTLGNLKPHSTQPHGRRISGDFKNLYTATTQETNFTTPTAGTITAVMDTGVSTLTVSNANLITFARDLGADDTEATVENIGFHGLSCTYA